MSNYDITTKELDRVWGHANFGTSISRRDVVRLGVLKCASGHHQGATSKAIVTELGLVTKEYKLTERGKECLWDWFSGGINF